MNRQKINELLDRSTESIYLFASFFMVFLLLIVLYFSFSYWTQNYPINNPIEDKMFYIAVGIAIVTSISQWIDGRIKSIIKSINILKNKGGVNGRKKD